MKTISVVLMAIAVLAAQEPAPNQESQEPSGPPAGARPGGRSAEPMIQPYEKVITKEAKSKKGIFTVHQIGERVYYEIPKDELGKDLLWVTQIARTTLGVGYGGQSLGSRVVRWERRDKRVLLRSVQYDIVADPNQPIARAVEAANNASILMAFPIAAIGKDDAPVIDVSRLFTTEVTEFSPRTRLRARGFDPSRSFLDRVAVFPQNIEVEATHTYTAPPETPGAAGAPPRPPTPTPSFFGTGMRPGSATVVMHFSMVKLPEKPMMPRLFDERVGYFSVRQLDYGKDEHRAPRRTYITRWRLEKKDPSARISEPVKPIVYYVDPATPAKWAPYVKRGIEAWQPAFEEAGFRNAIIAKDAPPPQEDPDWSAEDARYSVIRWLPSTIENASGPHVHDPRTGEILEADIQMYHNVMNLNKNWYFVQAGPLDERARKLPLPDALAGRLLEYVVAHEVGHTLGFQHNMKASSMYPAEKARDREWVKKMGHTPTLMDYSRFNYVAQPEDNIDPEDLIPKIGPYDKWATSWGYKPIDGAKTPEQEKQTLDEWARAQDQSPWLRFSTANSRGADSGELTEAVGDADAVYATTYGLKNLERVAGMLLDATTKPGENWDELQEVYARLLGQWTLEMNHVAQVVGGVNSQQKHGGQQGVLFTPVPKARQATAMAFLNANAFQTPKFAIRPEILRRIEPDGALTRVRTAQMSVMNRLLTNERLGRLTEQEAIEGANAYSAVEFLGDLRKGVWAELASPKAQIDAFRRNLQRGYLDVLNEKLNGRQPVSDDARALYRGELRSLSAEIGKSLAIAADRVTKLHLEDSRDRIAKILDPKFAAPAAPSTPVFTGRPSGSLGCWVDYAIE